MKVKFIPKEELDKVKFNSCVHYANNGNIFGYWWYLDAISKDWDALVEGDYESVMPLMRREEFPKTKVLYQAPLIRESGVYSINVLSPLRVKKFLEAIPADYKKINIRLNEQNTSGDFPDFIKTEKSNHQMLLMEPYENLANAYSESLKTKIQDAENLKLVSINNKKPEIIAEFYQNYSANRSELSRNFHAIQRIMYNVLHRGWGFASSVTDEKGEILATNFFVYSHKKVVSLLPVSSPKGKEMGAMELLMDNLIKTHAGRPLILDFNTMEDNQFAKDFGARSNIFYQVEQDRRKWKIF